LFNIHLRINIYKQIIKENENGFIKKKKKKIFHVNHIILSRIITRWCKFNYVFLLQLRFSIWEIASLVIIIMCTACNGAVPYEIQRCVSFHATGGNKWITSPRWSVFEVTCFEKIHANKKTIRRQLLHVQNTTSYAVKQYFFILVSLVSLVKQLSRVRFGCFSVCYSCCKLSLAVTTESV